MYGKMSDGGFHGRADARGNAAEALEDGSQKRIQRLSGSRIERLPENLKFMANRELPQKVGVKPDDGVSVYVSEREMDLSAGPD
jgi:hypothetical protein